MSVDSAGVHIDHALRARQLEERAIGDTHDDAMRLLARAQVHATLALADVQLPRLSQLPGSQALVDTIMTIVRETKWQTAQDELDAIYEALRQHGHAV